MGRPKKEEKTAELMISVEDFARTRDSVSRAPTAPDLSSRLFGFGPRRAPNTIGPLPLHQLHCAITRRYALQPAVDTSFVSLASMSRMTPFPPLQAHRVRVGLDAFSRQLQELSYELLRLLIQFQSHPNESVFLQVVTGLTTLQTAVSDLLRSYIKHTNSVLGSTPHSLDTIGISNPLGGELLSGALRNTSPAEAGASTATAAPAAAQAPAEEPKKGKRAKKEKKEKDPNEPKRPLTIYFLYAASARPIVKSDLGPEAQPGQIEQEIHRRWVNLSEEEKSGWKEVYTRNRDQYLKDMEKYKAEKAAAGAEAAVESPAATEEDAEMADDANPGAAAEEGSEESSTESPSDEEEESEKEPTPPPKAPTPPAETKTPKGNKRRKTGKENGTAAAAQAAAPAQKEEPKAAPKEEPKVEETEPKKKRNRKVKAEEVPAAPAPEPATAPATPAPEKKNKRKRKSEGATA
ncbi:hypothetical protein IWX50DRAFT_641871 [Phyllosticta citricarpa]|uniref:HMG box domain-containing protein n=1 Tax=Phyllosticta citricarpa TaxID=55181 RepID=A0ABR1MRI9_9PEZI